MNFRNVWLIWRREMLDQLRDRRTLFMVGVLPLLMYPLMGTSFLQLTQFMRHHEARVLLVNTQQLSEFPELPPLLSGDRFAESLVGVENGADRIQVLIAKRDSRSEQALAAARDRLASGDCDVVVYLPPGFAEQLDRQRRAIASRAPPGGPRAELEPQLFFSSTRESSQLAKLRAERVLAEWQQMIVAENLEAGNVPASATRPFGVAQLDVSRPEARGAALWSKLLPLVMFIWALTGAFYPAVDLCAGEKERGTLETLLTSPALRGEIVWGKLLTVISFSVASAVANLASLGVTGSAIAGQFRSLPGGDQLPLDGPSLHAMLWLLAALLPMAALYSSLSLAIAALARSTKEGQYYLMPLLLLNLPLMLLALSPGVRLDWGTALVPVTGMVLLLREAIEGNFATAVPMILPVTLVTLTCCLLAVRWAVSQFNDETVLFRDTENFEPLAYLHRLVTRRPEVPTFGGAIAAVAVIYLAQFAIRTFGTSLGLTPDTNGFVRSMLLSQIVCILLPVLVISGLFTSRPLKTLLLDRTPSVRSLLGAVLLAITLHPLGNVMVESITSLYPLPEELGATLQAFGKLAPALSVTLLLVALLPAICEELAFRGLVLSGLSRARHHSTAVVLSALFFGFAHTIFQQSLGAFVLGLVLAAIAIRTGSLFPGIVFHASYNSLQILRGHYQLQVAQLAELGSEWDWLLRVTEEGAITYSPVLLVVSGVAAAIVWWLAFGIPQRPPDPPIQGVSALAEARLEA